MRPAGPPGHRQRSSPRLGASGWAAAAPHKMAGLGTGRHRGALALGFGGEQPDLMLDTFPDVSRLRSMPAGR